jgi:glycosyltransferase 2 family protein
MGGAHVESCKSRLDRQNRWVVDGGKTVGRVARVAVSLGIVGYILYDVNRGHLLRAIAQIRPGYLAEATLLYAVGQALSGLKWAMLGRSVGLVRPWSEYVRFYFIGMFFNIFGLSTLGGDLVRALYLGRGKRLGLAINSVMFDRVSGLAILMALGSVALLTYPQPHLPWLLTAAATGGGIALVVGWWTCPRLVRLLPSHNALRRQVEVDLAPFWRDSWLLARVGAVSLAFHLSQVLVQYVLVQAAGADVPFTYCLVFHPILSVMMALPVSLGGFGVREGGYLYFLTQINIDDSVAVTAGLLWWAMSVLVALIGGLIFLASGARLPRMRSVEEPAAAV